VINLWVQHPILVIPVRNFAATQMATPAVTLTQLEQRDLIMMTRCSPQTMTTDALVLTFAAQIRTAHLAQMQRCTKQLAATLTMLELHIG
jgi:hypothetical protein